MSSVPGRIRPQAGQSWYLPTSGVETALFVGVQIVMAACVVLVVAQALA